MKQHVKKFLYRILAYALVDGIFKQLYEKYLNNYLNNNYM